MESLEQQVYKDYKDYRVYQEKRVIQARLEPQVFKGKLVLKENMV